MLFNPHTAHAFPQSATLDTIHDQLHEMLPEDYRACSQLYYNDTNRDTFLVSAEQIGAQALVRLQYNPDRPTEPMTWYIATLLGGRTVDLIHGISPQDAAGRWATSMQGEASAQEDFRLWTDELNKCDENIAKDLANSLLHIAVYYRKVQSLGS